MPGKPDAARVSLYCFPPAFRFEFDEFDEEEYYSFAHPPRT